MYVVVRDDLSFPQRAVQACHAAIKAARSFFSDDSCESPNLVLCSVESEAALLSLFARVQEAGVRACSFQEEDLGGQTTAFATELVSGEKRRTFRECQLLKMEVLRKEAA